jgi:hypothetical protein
MGALKNTEEAALLDYSLDTATVYLALYTVAPTDSTNGTEVTGGGYERKEITLSTSTSGLKTNSADLVFGPATENWGDVAGAAVCDATTTGNQKWYSAISPADTVNSGYTYTISAGSLVFTAD